MSDTASDIRVSRLDATDTSGRQGRGAAFSRRTGGELQEKYKLLEEVGQGGMAVVYRGFDTLLEREVAIKILHPHLAKEEESKQRFQREAHAVAKLRHDNILEIYDYSGIESDESFIVTEFIRGQTLKAFLNRTPISHPEIAAMIVFEVASALDHAHGLGIIHRDIKPENIMIRSDGRIKLMDFGIAQIVDVRKLTVTGQLLGSPAYMAPELVRGKPLDFRSDVFSTGTLLYQLATGELPFKGRNPHEVLKRIADGNYVTPEVANPVVDAKMGSILRKALAHEPEDRYQTIDDLRRDLSAFLADVGIMDPRRELAAYFVDTMIYSRELQDRVVSAVSVLGENALKRGEKVAALAYFDRVLCTDPRNAAIIAHLDRFSRQRRLGRVIAVLILALGLGVAGWLIVTYWPARPLPALLAQDGGTPVGDVSKDLPATSLDPTSLDGGQLLDHPFLRDLVSPRTDRPKRRIVKPPRRPNVHLGPVGASRTIEILPHPKAVTIFLGKRRLGDYGPDLQRITVPPGAQTLTFRNEACCFDKVVHLGKGRAPKTLRVTLAWKPARLTIRLVPPRPDAVIAVGKIIARPGRAVTVSIPAASLDGRTAVDVNVSAVGFVAVSRHVAVRANHNQTLTLSLARTP
ncbi:MAG: protein kinase [Deltaproteobacteria bacterium]|nr:protein kinase [Deltaproteobacteria bacterium]